MRLLPLEFANNISIHLHNQRCQESLQVAQEAVRKVESLHLRPIESFERLYGLLYGRIIDAKTQAPFGHPMCQLNSGGQVIASLQASTTAQA